MTEWDIGALDLIGLLLKRRTCPECGGRVRSHWKGEERNFDVSFAGGSLKIDLTPRTVHRLTYRCDHCSISYDIPDLPWRWH